MFMQWRSWLRRQFEQDALLSRARFVRKAQSRHARIRQGTSAVLIFEIDRLADADRVLGTADADMLIRAVASSLAESAEGGLVTSLHRGAFLVHMLDVEASAQLVRSMRALAEDAAGAGARGEGERGPPASSSMLTWTIGASTLSPHQDFFEAIRLAEDALLIAKREGGDCIRWHSGQSSVFPNSLGVVAG